MTKPVVNNSEIAKLFWLGARTLRFHATAADVILRLKVTKFTDTVDKHTPSIDSLGSFGSIKAIPGPQQRRKVIFGLKICPLVVTEVREMMSVNQRFKML